MSRVLLIDADKTHDVFELVEVRDGLVRVRTAFLYEIGEELRLQLERDGATSETIARVRAHVGDGPDKITELELVG